MSSSQDVRVRKAKKSQQYSGAPSFHVGSASQNNVPHSDFVSETSKKTRHIKGNTDSLSLLHWLCIALIIGGVYSLCLFLDNRLPDPVSDRVAGPGQFSEERVRTLLDQIVGFGPRPTGSYEAETLTKQFLVKQIEAIKAQASESLKLELDIQKPSGCFDVERFLDQPWTNCYRNVTNVVARLGGKTQAKHSVLISCHFDSVPQSVGASDDAVSCAAMLEILSILSKEQKPRTHDLIFLFNGAEENILQAAHGFITQHPWRHTIRAFVNLEACGAGGREFLFQAGPDHPWLLQTYLDSASHVHCSVMGQEVFQSGLIPSDTDFRIYRDYGRIPGLDIAYIRNGYVYHTEFDTSKFIDAGSIQRAGENLFEVVKTLADSPHVANPGSANSGHKVFFDFIGLFVVSYPVGIGKIIHMSAVALVLLKVLLNIFGCIRGHYTVSDFAFAAFVHLMAAGAAISTVFLCAKLTVMLGLTLFWYSRPYLLIPIYLGPSCAAALFVHDYVRTKISKNKDPWQTERLFFDVAMTYWAAGVCLLTFFDLASAYFLFLYTASALIRDTVKAVLSKLGLDYRWKTAHVFVHMFCLIIPMFIGSYGVLEVLQVFIPIMGRSGAKLNPEVFIGAIVAMISITFSLFLGSLVYISRGTRYISQVLFGITVGAYLVLFFSWLSLPYNWDESAPTLRRLHLQHISRRIFDLKGNEINKDSGVWVILFDYRGSGDLPIHTFLAASKPSIEACVVNDTTCGYPFYLPVGPTFFENSRYMLTPHGPKVHLPVHIKLLSKNRLSDTKVNLTFSVTGPDHITLNIKPKDHWRLKEWSFTDLSTWPPVEPEHNYFVYLSEGQLQPDWKFYLVLEAVEGTKTPASLDVAHLHIGAASHFLHGSDFQSDTIKSIITLGNERRQKMHLSLGWWKWLVTISGWNSEYEGREF